MRSELAGAITAAWAVVRSYRARFYVGGRGLVGPIDDDVNALDRALDAVVESRAGGLVLIAEEDPRRIAVDRGLSESVREALQEAQSVCASIRTGNDRKIAQDSCVMYAQTEAWCRWAEFEVLPKIKAALAASAPSQAEPHRGQACEVQNCDPDSPTHRQWFPARFVALDLTAGEPIVQRDGAMPVFATWGSVRGIQKPAPSQAGSCQASGPCKTCRGSGVVDDGWMTHSEGGAEFNEPIKCVKDCPDCGKTAPPADRTLTDDRIAAGLFKRGPSGQWYQVQSHAAHLPGVVTLYHADRETADAHELGPAWTLAEPAKGDENAR